MVIYKITNTVTEKAYVGQTIGRLSDRFDRHACKGNFTPISRAMYKYGRKAFTIDILETCTSAEALNTAERKWILALNTIAPGGYNLTTGGDSGGKQHPDVIERRIAPLRGRKMSPEFSAQLSKNKKGRPLSAAHREKLSLAARGKPLSQDTLDALQRGRNQPHTPERRIKQSVCNGRRRLTDDDILEIRRIYAAKEATQSALALRFGVIQCQISRIIRGVAFSWLKDPKPFLPPVSPQLALF